MAGILSRLFRRAPESEQRQGGNGFYSGFAATTGHHVSAHAAESVAAITSCISLISGAIASLPAELVVDTDAGRKPAPSGAAGWRVLQRPNRFQSWPSYASWVTAQLLLHGNAVSYIQTDGRGAALSLVPAAWPWLLPRIVGTRLAFDLVQVTPEIGLLGLPQRMLDSDVLHVRSRSDYGIVGRAVLSRAGGPVQEALEIATTATSFFRNGMRPSAVMTAPQYLSAAQRETFGEEFARKFTGTLAAGKIPLLEGGWKLENASFSGADAEFVAQRQFSVSDIARLFQIPDALLQTGTRILPDPTPHLMLFASQCLAPIVASIEAEFDQILPTGMHLVLDMAGLQRGSFSAVTAAMAALKQSGIISANDGREALGWPSVEGGDELGTSNPPNYPPDFQGSTALHPSPGHVDGEPQMPSHNNSGSKANGATPPPTVQ